MRLAQTPLKQLFEQHWLFCVQALPVASRLLPWQQTLPAQPLAGGVQVVPLHVVTGLAQALLKQLPEQHWLPWVHALPLARRLSPWQQMAPAQPLAGGVHVVPSQVGTRLVQTL